jgi:tRNA (guanine-N7-)-methyltransferase
MKRRCRQHVNPLKLSNLVPHTTRLDLPEGRTTEVELGCGDSEFLIQLAQLHPDQLFFGVDIRPAFFAPAEEKIHSLGLYNLAIVAANLIVESDRLFPLSRIRRFYINFPDPWFKLRHRNRRWLTRETVGHLVRALEPSGEIFFQSDVWSLAIETMALLEENLHLANRCGEWTFLRENPFSVRSSRELSCQEEGRKVWRLLYSHLTR